MDKRGFRQLVRGHLPFQDLNSSADAYIDAVIAAMQEALLEKGRLSLNGVGSFEVVETVTGARVVYRPAPAIRQIAEEYSNGHSKQGY